MADTNTFTRDSLATYEKQTPKVVPDHVPPTEKEIDVQASEKPAADDTATPSSDDGESVDQSATGDGTSDEQADSSTASDEPSVDSETDGEGGEAKADEEANAAPPPKKGSAAARIQELLDLTEGYKLYGKQRDAQLEAAQAEIARLKKLEPGTPAPKADTATAPQSEKDDPMPRLEDPDINFDTDKLEVKMRKWIRSEAAKAAVPAAAKAVETDNLNAEQKRVAAEFNNRLTTFAKDHPDFEKVVLKNPVLNANQLSQKASAVMVKSPLSAELMYYFGTNTDEAVRIAKLPEAEQLVEMGEVISKVKAAKASAQPTTKDGKPGAGAKPASKKSLSQAPPPPSPTKGGGRAQERDVTDPNMGMDEFARQHREGKQSRRIEHQKLMRGGK